jgi:hypothetical protein
MEELENKKKLDEDEADEVSGGRGLNWSGIPHIDPIDPDDEASIESNR